ncbi:MAG: hypothetical protein JO107_02135 [Hyphomicrobiales bacterium]|nr:hypothetical protein [Hyphomicrobiales bacterium]
MHRSHRRTQRTAFCIQTAQIPAAGCLRALLLGGLRAGLALGFAKLQMLNDLKSSETL